jgi:6-phosphogluconate dehydrogenase (decarboxylating)
MQLGLVGLGKMGFNMRERLRKDGAQRYRVRADDGVRGRL